MYYEVANFPTDIFHAMGCIPTRNYGGPAPVGCNFGDDPGYTMKGKRVPHVGADRTIRGGHAVARVMASRWCSEGMGLGSSTGRHPRPATARVRTSTRGPSTGRRTRINGSIHCNSWMRESGWTLPAVRRP
jgi:hypothetical protein